MPIPPHSSVRHSAPQTLADGQEGRQAEGRGLPIPACGRPQTRVNTNAWVFTRVCAVTELQHPSCSELLGVLTLKHMRVCADGGILGRYYSGRNSTHAVLERKDSGLDFDWSIFSPAPHSIPPGTVSTLHESQSTRKIQLVVCDAIACAEWSILMPRWHGCAKCLQYPTPACL